MRISLTAPAPDADMDDLLLVQGVNEDNLDKLYESVQDFIEREIEEEVEEIEMNIESELISDDSNADKINQEEE